jgi:alpha/beta superfamily hydrolase
MPRSAHTKPLDLHAVDHERTVRGIEQLLLHTDEGTIPARFHPAEEGDTAAVWLTSLEGGFEGPGHGMFRRVAERLPHDGISSLRIDYRQPGDWKGCVQDALLGVEYLAVRKPTRVVLVGHGFGAAVAIAAGVDSPNVAGVAALSCQLAGTERIADLSPRPLLLMHGSKETTVPEELARRIFERASQPKHLQIYPMCADGLVECHEQIEEDLLQWIRQVLLTPERPASA